MVPMGTARMRTMRGPRAPKMAQHDRMRTLHHSLLRNLLEGHKRNLLHLMIKNDLFYSKISYVYNLSMNIIIMSYEKNKKAYNILLTRISGIFRCVVIVHALKKIYTRRVTILINHVSRCWPTTKKQTTTKWKLRYFLFLSVRGN